MADAIVAEKKWSSVACFSVDVFALLDRIHQRLATKQGGVANAEQ